MQLEQNWQLNGRYQKYAEAWKEDQENAKSRANRLFVSQAKSAHAVAISVKIPKNGSAPTPGRQLRTVSDVYGYSNKEYQIKDAVYETDVHGQAQKLVCVRII